MSGVRIGVDVGGTFTDLVLADSARDGFFAGKLLTTPDDPGRAILSGIERLLDEADVRPGEVAGVVHGTTLVTNTVIERTGAKVGLITTAGFRDSLEIGKEIRYDLYDLFLEPPPTLVSRHLRREVRGRIDAHGEVLEPLDLDEVRAVVRSFSGEDAVDAIAVCFMHAYRNPEHEQAVGQVVAEEMPGVALTLSSEVAPEIREFERASTACANAYVQPLMQGYLGSLATRLRALGVEAPLHVMLSGGGIASVAQCERFPIRLIESGPAAGAMAARHYGAMLDTPDLISFDMGGTTAKICLIEDGRPRRAFEFEAGRVRRFARGSGIPLKITVVDMIEIGAGGGSIASSDAMGLLKVGPRSAGSVPGPVSYGLGGAEPAVTDCDLLLGFLDPGYFLGGEMQLELDSVRDAVTEKLAKPLGIDRTRAALGVHQVVNENMAAATRRYMAEKGRDPRRYTMIAFGGAGPVHAYGLAKMLKLERIIVPFGAGVTSALGFLVAPPAVDDVRSYVARLDSLDWDAVNALFADMERDATAQLLEAGALPEQISFERSADMRHVGQGFEISVNVPATKLEDDTQRVLSEAFFESYERLFERRVSDVPVEVMSWRLQASTPAPAVGLEFLGARSHSDTPAKGVRTLEFDGVGQVSAPVLDRYALAVGYSGRGPAVIEERESTTIIGPDAEFSVNQHRNLIIELD